MWCQHLNSITVRVPYKNGDIYLEINREHCNEEQVRLEKHGC